MPRIGQVLREPSAIAGGLVLIVLSLAVWFIGGRSSSFPVAFVIGGAVLLLLGLLARFWRHKDAKHGITYL